MTREAGEKYPLLKSNSGSFSETKKTIGQVLTDLDSAFSNRPTDIARRPGDLSNILRQHPLNAEVGRDLSIAIYGSRALSGQDKLTERSTAEKGMLAQAATKNLFSDIDVVIANKEKGEHSGRNTYQTMKDIGKRGAVSLVQSGLVKTNDSVFEVGAGYGSMTKQLRKLGVSVVSVEPSKAQYVHDMTENKKSRGKILTPKKKEELEKILPETVEDYATNHPGEKFSVVLASNFYPNTDSFQMTEALSSLTSHNGKTLLGVAGVDPQDISNTSHNITRHFEPFYGSVAIKNIDDIPEYKDHFSVAGNIAFIECKQPKIEKFEKPQEDECCVM